MNKEIKKKWIEALLSGKYKQGKHKLKSQLEEKYCCLGVLCDLVDPSRWTGLNNAGYRTADAEINELGFVTDLLPEDVQKLAELSADDQDILVDLNDSNSSFPEIAKYIEENL